MLTLDQVKSKSAGSLGKLHPVLQAAADELIQRSYAKGVPIIITQGMRTIAEQNALYAQGRTKKGPIVTNAREAAVIIITDWPLILRCCCRMATTCPGI